MADTKNVSLTGHLAEFVDRNVASGSFQNASEVVREGLRLLERQQREDELKLAALREAVSHGLRDLDEGRLVAVEPGGIADYLRSLSPET
ncbi:MAG: type II toxin-antitoxin system ParD family antitoxin [Alphaproteobacteria bacterium]|nr:type II toxin-antitoxin system ParD family antitoxin [Alphaproteobacteria bacterium]